MIRQLKYLKAGFKEVSLRKHGPLPTLMKDSTIVEQIRNDMLALESSLRDFNCLHNEYDSKMIGQMDQCLRCTKSRIKDERAVLISL